VDLGIVEPVRKDAMYALHPMRAQLTDGAMKSAREILLENAMLDYFRVDVVVSETVGDEITVQTGRWDPGPVSTIEETSLRPSDRGRNRWRLRREDRNIIVTCSMSSL